MHFSYSDIKRIPIECRRRGGPSKRRRNTKTTHPNKKLPGTLTSRGPSNQERITERTNLSPIRISLKEESHTQVRPITIKKFSQEKNCVGM